MGDMNNHEYIIKIYIYGTVVREYNPPTYKDAQRIFMCTYDSIDCYTQLIVDGKEYTINEASYYLDPDYKIRNNIRNSRGMDSPYFNIIM